MWPLWILTPSAWVFWPVVEVMLSRRKRRLSVVLWVRRFHRGSGSKQFFRLWQQAVGPWGQIVTLSDEQVRSPHVIYILIAVLFVGLQLMVRFIPLDKPFASGTHIADPAESIFVLLLSIPIIAGVFYVIFKRSVTRIHSSADIEKIAHVVRQIREEKLFVYSGGARFITCQPENDDIWRLAIGKLAQNVDVVILDFGGGLTQNIDWEVTTLAKYCVKEQIIVAIPEGAPIPQLSNVALGNTSNNSQLVTYPICVPWIAISKRAEAIFRPLQKAIGLAALGRLDG